MTAKPFFDDLPRSIQQKIEQAIVLYPFEKGTIFYQQHESSCGLFGLQQGKIKLYRQSQARLQILGLLGEGMLFGAESLLDGGDNPYSAEAITEGQAIYIEAGKLQTILVENPEFLNLLLALLWGRLRQFTVLVHSLAFRDVSARLAETLLQMMELENKSTPQGICVPRLLSQQEMAAMVGTAREVIYRTCKKFEKNHLIQVLPHEIIILDLEGLKALAEETV